MEDQRAFNELVMDHFYPTRAAAGHETDGDVVLAANGTLRPTPHAATYLRPSEPTLTPTFTPTLTFNPTRPALPLALGSSHSFAADLSLLLCAQSLVLASSSLSGEGGLLRDSPHLRDVYRFEPSEEGCLPAAPPRRMVKGSSWQYPGSLPWPAGAESPGSWLRYALGTSRSASQGPKGGCSAAVRPGQSGRF